MTSHSKNVILLLLLLASTILPAYSQKADTITHFKKNRVSIAPFGFINKVRIRYERTMSNSSSMGIEASIYYKTLRFPGIQVPITLKQFIFKREKFIDTYHLSGIYIMVQCGFAYHTFTAYDDIHYKSGGGILSPADYYVNKEFNVVSKGTLYGLSIGWQGFLDKKLRLSLDTYAGAKFFALDNNIDSYYAKNYYIFGSNTTSFSKNRFSEISGAGSTLVLGVNLGYNF